MASEQKLESETQSPEPVAPATTADAEPAAAAAPATTADAKPAAETAAATNYSSTEAPTKDVGDDGGILLRLKEIARDEAWWCFNSPLGYISLESCAHGCVPVANPVCADNTKCFCCESYCTSEDCMTEHGLNHSLVKCCCCVGHSAIPPSPSDGVPMCALCGHNCGEDAKTDDTTRYVKLLQETWFLVYCLCFGAGCTKDMWDPVCWQQSKGCPALCCPCFPCCCIRSACKTEELMGERPMYHHFDKCCCFMNAGNINAWDGLRRDGIPACACCGKTCCGEPLPEQQPIVAKPAQQSM